MSRALLYDSTLCIGCQQCEQACAAQNKLPYDDSVAKEQRTSDHKYTYVAKLTTRGEEKYMRRMCMQCNDPTCVSVCPVGALEKTKDGPVTYDESKCMGCRYCMVACPFGVPKYEWAKAIPRVRKCIMCPDRLAAGKQTACAEACPTGATLFGNRNALLQTAHQRINDNPLQYFNHVYGENEVGGTSMLFMTSANVPFEQFGFPVHYGTQALPPLTANVLNKVPNIVGVGWAVLGGIWWITNRREDVAKAEEKQP
jgi:formate dehydrogenase iron-sulfur subunit